MAGGVAGGVLGGVGDGYSSRERKSELGERKLKKMGTSEKVVLPITNETQRGNSTPEETQPPVRATQMSQK